jgi:group I intron endonuclease
MYIYRITNKINDKVYVGQTVQSNPKMRWYAHLDYCRKGRKSHLYDSMRKHGIDNFNWEVIDQSTSIEELNNLEAKWLAHYRLLGEVYNNREAGGNKKHSADSIEKMRRVHTRRHATNVIGGWKRRDGGAMKGKSHPGKGTKRTEEQRARITEGLTDFFASEKGIEARRKISDAGRDTANIEKRKQGFQKMLDSEKGTEYRKKISESVKKVWDKRKAKQGTFPC